MVLGHRITMCKRKKMNPHLIHIIIKKLEGIKDLNIRAKITKLFGKKHDVYLCDLKLVIVLAMTSKVETITTKTNRTSSK